MSSMIEETDRANRFFWILEYIDMDRSDPVSTVQTQMESGMYRKKQGSRYDSSNGDLSLFAMISPMLGEECSHPSGNECVSSNERASSSNERPSSSNERPQSSTNERPQPSTNERPSSNNEDNAGAPGRRWGSPNEGHEGGRVLKRSLSSRYSRNDGGRRARGYSREGQASSPSHRGNNRGNGYFAADRSRSFNSVNRNSGGTTRGYRRTNSYWSRPHGHNASFSHPRELQRWDGEDEGAECRTLEEMRSGNTSFDQFSINKEKFGIDAEFNEELYTVPMSSYEVDEDEWRRVVDAAREIERGGGNDDGRERIAGELGDGEEDSVLYSDVVIHKKEPKEGENQHGEEEDSFIDSSIRRTK